MKFRKEYFLAFVALFIVEVFIALCIKDDFVRPYVGDLLAVIGVYFLVMSFLDIEKPKAVILSLLVAYAIEFLQYVDFLSIVKWQDNKFLRIVFGSTFNWGDMVAYTLGALLVFIVDNKRKLK